MLERLRKNKSKRDADFGTARVTVVAGLGNPGHRYRDTRHNLGFMVADHLCGRFPPGPTRKRFQTEYVEVQLGDRKLIVAKPQTFMNESGAAVGQLVRWFNVPLDQLLLVYDELDLPFGTIRLRPGGSAGGHNGVASVISHLKSPAVPRLRVGIGRPAIGSTVPYVLSPFNADERRQLPDVLTRATDATIAWMDNGMEGAMNTFNRRVAASEDAWPAT